jgi:hypothetical protein
MGLKKLNENFEKMFADANNHEAMKEVRQRLWEKSQNLNKTIFSTFFTFGLTLYFYFDPALHDKGSLAEACVLFAIIFQAFLISYLYIDDIITTAASEICESQNMNIKNHGIYQTTHPASFFAIEQTCDILFKKSTITKFITGYGIGFVVFVVPIIISSYLYALNTLKVIKKSFPFIESAIMLASLCLIIVNIVNIKRISGFILDAYCLKKR